METQASLQECFALLEGNAVRYLSIGAGKRALVFLSGWGCDASLWREQVPALAPHARLLFVDLPGHGGSAKPDIAYTIPMYTRAVDAVMQDAGVEKAALAGHSMGAMVAYQYARDYPRKTVALIWVDGACAIPMQVEEQIASAKLRAANLRKPDYRENLLHFVDTLFIPETPAAVRQEIRESILATPQHVLASTTEGLAAPEMFTPAVLDIPAFAIFCQFWHPEKYIDIFRKYLPRLEYEVMQGSGHYLMLEKPAETSAALLRIMEKMQWELT